MSSRQKSFYNFLLVFLCLIFVFKIAAPAQEGVPLFTTDFPPEEFAARRAKIFDEIGKNGIALLQGEPSPKGYTRFRQSNEFYYLSGIEVPHAYLLLHGARRTATLYLPHRNEECERGEGKLLSAADAEMVKNLSGADLVFSAHPLGEHLAIYSWAGGGGGEMQVVLGRSKFSKPIYEQAAREFVES